MANSTLRQSASFAWDERKSLNALEKQLASLQQLKGHSYADGRQQEQEWKQTTEVVFEHSFAPNSPAYRNFQFAKNSSSFRAGGVPPATMQSNFDKRIEKYETCIKSAIAGIHLGLDESVIQGHYEAGDPFAFYKDLKSLVRSATRSFFLVDAYLDSKLFELYVNDIPTAVQIRILSNNLQSGVTAVARVFAGSRPNFELKTANQIHDRILFVDDRCWAIGQSIKDAAMKKPTYIVELDSTRQAPLYQQIWETANSVIKS